MPSAKDNKSASSKAGAAAKAEGPASGGQAPAKPPAAPAAAAAAESAAEKDVLAIDDILASCNAKAQGEGLQTWAKTTVAFCNKRILTFMAENAGKWSFSVPESLLMLKPLSVNEASGSSLTAFREVMQIDNLRRSLQHSGEYEGAGLLWWVDVLEGLKFVNVSMLEGALPNVV